MSVFKAPVDDILFSLRHVARVSELAEWDDATAESVISHFAVFAEDVIAPLNMSGDAEGARFENGRVYLPRGFKHAYAQLSDGGWQGLSAPVELGGQNLSPLIGSGITEIFAGANHALQMISSLAPGAIATLRLFASEQQQAQWIPKLASGEYLSTMCLTEPGAGSDLSAITCRAEQTVDGWTLTGEKIFISGGDHDLSDGILHLVLARSGAVGTGLDGLSLFLCPSQTEVSVTRIEQKMGLHASPTCQMLFSGAEVELLGREGDGLNCMFRMMNELRIDVALQGVAHAAHAAQTAQDYANQRQQGRRFNGHAAYLSDHADVRRMLDEQRCMALGARSMCHIAIKERLLDTRPALVEFLTSLCKIVGSEAGVRSADLGIQILGGYGYLTEYGLSQTWRDARITTIYEGANGIHERGLVTRGIRAGGGAEGFMELIAELAGDHPSVVDGVKRWTGSVKSLRALDDATPYAHAFSLQSAELLQKAVWVRIATVAHQHVDADEIRRLSGVVLTDATF